MSAVTLNLDSIAHVTHDQFCELCRENRNLRLELTAKGGLIVMPPTGWESGNRNIEIAAQIQNWTKRDKTGMAFDSSTGFILPSGAIRSPDAAWVSLERLTALNPNPEGFLPLAPDFVIELRSALPSLRDSKAECLKPLQDKMQEYIDNGVRLGFLLNPQDRVVEIYRLGKGIEVLQSPTEVSGEDVLPAFVLTLEGIFGS
jgi:Uma2 family endonuclease